MRAYTCVTCAYVCDVCIYASDAEGRGRKQDGAQGKQHERGRALAEESHHSRQEQTTARRSLVPAVSAARAWSLGERSP